MSSGADKCIWGLTPPRNFSVKSAYLSLFDDDELEPWPGDFIWKLHIPPKLETVLWPGDSGTVMEAELWGLFHGLHLAWNEGCKLLKIECDSQAVIHMLTHDVVDSHPLFSLINGCKEFLGKGWLYRLCTDYREQNRAADHLAAAQFIFRFA